MTIVIRDPAYRQRLARKYRMTRKAERQRKQQQARFAEEMAAYQARQPELIKAPHKREAVSPDVKHPDAALGKSK